MADGAHLGVRADQALETILGGKPQPEQPMTAEAFEHYIRSAPESIAGSKDGGEAYGEASRIAAALLLRVLERHPELQDRPLDPVYNWKAVPKGHNDYSREALAPYLVAEGIWQVASQEESGLEQLDLTGFMAGWAFNAARKVLGLGPVRNPALVEITTQP